MMGLILRLVNGDYSEATELAIQPGVEGSDVLCGCSDFKQEAWNIA